MTAPCQYGASFVDPVTELRFEMHHPAVRPDRWEAYVAGALREYERYGIAGLVDEHALARADGVSLFFVAVDDDERVVAGLRCHGPLDDAAAAQALGEMTSSPEWRDHRAAIESITPFGVVEMKGAWRETSGDGNQLVAAPMVRCCVHALEWLGAEVLLAAVADRMGPLLATIGSLMMGTEASAYPSEKYRTILTALHRARYREVIDDVHAKLLRHDAEELLRTSEDAVATGWRPIVLDARHRADRHILANLRADPGVTTVDVFDRQRAELAGLLPPPGARLLEEPARHVYYPWRRTVVRMLGPDSFSVVRLDRNRNRITREEQERLRRQRVGVVGLSSGHAVATTIAMEGLCGELRLTDFDEVELTNLNRVPASVLDVGVNKAVAAARRVAEIDPYLPVRISPRGVTADNADEFVAGLDIVVEQCDEIAMKLLVREVARRHGVTVVMETSDRGLLDVERFDLEPERPFFHGLLGDTTSRARTSLSVAEKIPHVLAIVDPSRASARGAASLAEIGRTLSTWPQLGSDVALGGASVAATVRMIGLGEQVQSGRTRIDLDTAITSLEQPRTSARGAGTPATAALHGAAVAMPLDPVDAADPVDAVLHAASRAPSGGNVQPWRLTLGGHELAIELDRSRALGVMDVRARASYVSIGAALFNARVAAAAKCRLGRVQLQPDGPASDVVATLELADGADEELAALYEPMLQRCSNRNLGAPASLDLAVVGRLTRAAAAEGAALHLTTDRERVAQCAQILGETERIRFLTPALLEQTVQEMRWPGDDARTGIDVATLELSGAELATLALMRRNDVMALLERWDGGGGLGDYLKRSVLSSSAIAVVTVDHSSCAAYVAGGMALERVWIEAQHAGLAVQAIGPCFLYAVQHTDFETLGGTRWAQSLRGLSADFRRLFGLGDRSTYVLVLRFSHAPPPTARSERLPLESVVYRHGLSMSH
ncbi:MAG: Rv1355c family protein [Acidimicrobiales bacterium]